MITRSNNPKHLKKRGRPWLLLLLLVPCALLLWPGLYSLDQPELIGIPFFYWYQILCIVITAILIMLLSRATD